MSDVVAAPLAGGTTTANARHALPAQTPRCNVSRLSSFTPACHNARRARGFSSPRASGRSSSAVRGGERDPDGLVDAVRARCEAVLLGVSHHCVRTGPGSAVPTYLRKQPEGRCSWGGLPCSRPGDPSDLNPPRPSQASPARERISGSVPGSCGDLRGRSVGRSRPCALC
jgi:hypothetical protein